MTRPKKTRRQPAFFIAFVFCFSALASGQNAEDKTLRLAIGNPKLKDKTAQVAAGTLLSAASGKTLTFAEMIREMKDSRFVYIGESHDDLATHDIQLKIIQALHQSDQMIAVGLEMLPAETQPVLDEWSRGILGKEDFLREVKWYVHWNMNFGYYEKIFDFAREKNIPLLALNAPREVISKIRMKGWESLTQEEKALVPQPDLAAEEHRLLIRTIFESSELPHQMKGEGLEKMFDGLYRAQAAWDEVMAANAIRGAEVARGKMIVLAGSGHLLYNLGINRRVYERNRLAFKTVVAVSLPAGEKTLSVSRSLADYVWGIAEQERPAYPAVGLAFKKADGLQNVFIERKPFDGAALGADFEKGDVVLAVDGKSFDDINGLRIYLSGFKWDEQLKFRLLRDGETREVLLKFRQAQPGQTKADEKAPPEKGMTGPSASMRREKLEKQIKNLLRDAEGEVGIAVKHIESGQEFELGGSASYPMASAFKVPVLVEVMAQVKEGKFALDEEVGVLQSDQHLGSGLLSSLTAPGVRLSVRNLINLMMLISDNSATDILLAKVGAANVNRRLRELGIEGISVDRPCQELIMDFVGLDYEKYRGLPLDQVTAELTKTRSRNREEHRQEVKKFGQNPEDQSTPLSMSRLLEKIFKKEILDRESCDLILSVMLRCQTGAGRIKAGLPEGTALAHKTGTIAGTVNDCGIIYLPDGAGHVVLTVLTKDFADTKTADVEEIIAGIARFVYDYFYFTN